MASTDAVSARILISPAIRSGTGSIQTPLVPTSASKARWFGLLPKRPILIEIHYAHIKEAIY